MRKYDITVYGAVADGKTICTNEIQRAIDACEKYGTVYIPSGTFVTGALYLKSNMTLYLEKGARLLGSSDVKDFPIMGYRYEGLDQLCYASLINTDGAPYENITIDGEGVIDANGKALFEEEFANVSTAKRGRTICIRNTDNLTIRGVTIRQSPAWCLHLVYCKNVIIEGISLHSKRDENGVLYGMHNCDGIDVDSCKHVIIRNSHIASQDDSVAVKSGRDTAGRRVGIPSENIVIESCTFTGGFGVAMGSEISGGVKDVFVRNCTFEDTFSIASVKTTHGRGAYIKNIHYENCSLVNRDTTIGVTKWFKGALYIDGYYGCDEFDSDTPVEVNEGTTVIEDIYFKNITLETVAGHAIYMCGYPELPFKNIRLENVRAHGEYGTFIKNIENIEMIDVEVTSDNN